MNSSVCGNVSVMEAGYAEFGMGVAHELIFRQFGVTNGAFLFNDFPSVVCIVGIIFMDFLYNHDFYVMDGVIRLANV